METLLACLTPPGKAAIATIGVRGPNAWAVTRQLFTPTLPDEPTAGRYWFGRLGAESRDEVILAVKDAAPTLEIHCHGGIEVVRMIQELYQQHGARIIPWQEFATQTPREARLLDLLARAPTTRTAGILLDQWVGAVSTDRLHELAPLGRHLVEPWKVVIAGAPNVGKSSLMNALAGYARSIVAPTPGTTRDVVTVQLAIDGWPIEMTDTAGLRDAASDLESQGIERARAALRDADLRLWLVDGSAEPIFPDETHADWSIVINKIDLPAAWDWSRVAAGVRISTVTQAGLAELCALISRRLVPNPPVPGEAVPWEVRG